MRKGGMVSGDEHTMEDGVLIVELLGQCVETVKL